MSQGFSGKIYSTPPTKDIASYMFDDALKVMRDELGRRGNALKPLYDENDIARTFELWETHEYHKPIHLEGGVRAHFFDAGHVLGSAMVEFERKGRKIVFTGDLGNDHTPISKKTETITDASYVVMESVYGDRNHEGTEVRREVLKEAIEYTRKKNGTLLIPAFSLERTQILLYEISSLIAAHKMEPLPVYLDAPLAIRLMSVYRDYPSYLNDEVQGRMSGGDPFTFKGLKITASANDSRAIYTASNPKVIIAGAGMSSGGRIRSHERVFLSDPTTTILFPGYQSVGSLGRRLAEGARKVNIDGQWVRVRAKIGQLQGYSAHKDMDGLIAFVENTVPKLKKAFVVMGEPRSALFLTQRLRDFLGVDAVAPAEGESVELDW